MFVHFARCQIAGLHLGMMAVFSAALLGSMAPARADVERPSVAAVSADGGTFGKDNTLIYRASVPDQPWNGWGASSPPNPHPELEPTPVPEQFDLVENGPSPRIFSGKVVVKGPSMTGVEVGLISLVGIQWNVPDAYQWQPVAPDGTFSITDAHHLDAPKALAVRGPYTPWTFFRYNFNSTQSAKNIVLKADPAKIVRLTASGADMVDLSDVGFEPFHAHTQFDDQGKPLRRQQLNYYKSGGQKFMDLVLPMGEIAIFVHHQGFAGYYQVIDTRRANHFHFVLLHAGRIKLVVVDQNGQPKGNFTVHWINPAAPLSLGAWGMKADGQLLLDNLVPGTIELSVPGFAMKKVEVAEGKTTEVRLQDGIDP